MVLICIFLIINDIMHLFVHPCLLRLQEVVPKHLNYQGHMGEKLLLGFNVGDYDSGGTRWELGCSALKKVLS